ncbi:hypothetical protein FKM82_005933 [Ascaphus truei]
MNITPDKIIAWKDLVQYQIHDPVAGIVRQALQQDNPSLLKRAPKEMVALLMKEINKFELDNCLLYRVVPYHNHPDRRQLFLPKILQPMVLRALHDDHGHLGIDKTFGLLRDRFFWPKMRESVELHCRRCTRCIQWKTLPTRAAPMAHLKSSGPMDLVCMDFLCIEPDTRGIGNVLVITDHYTRYAQAFPTKDQRVVTVAKVLWEKYFLHYGLPNRLHSDQVRDFESNLIRELLKLLSITKSQTTPYHPEGDAMPERFNRALLDVLGTLKGSQKTEWTLLVSYTVWSQWGTSKFRKGGVYHIPAEHESWEDIRENVLNYNEEGGGEHDQNGYNMHKLKKPLRANFQQLCTAPCDPTPSRACQGPENRLCARTAKRPAQEGAAATVTNVPDFREYVCQIVWAADNDVKSHPADLIHSYSTEGQGSAAGSLSSLGSSNIDEDLNYDYLHEWGSKFDRLKELYQASDGQT